MSEQIKVELQDVFGNDEVIANAAWTSSIEYQKKKPRTTADVERIINMLADLKHSVPFESIVFRFWIKMPIAIDRQFMTHRLQSASGMSGRYRTMPNEYLHIPRDVVDISNMIEESGISCAKYHKSCTEANNNYQELLKKAKEVEKTGKITNKEYRRFREFYRGMLPQHNMTERVTVMNLRSFSNFIKLRNSEHAQPEIKQVAEQMLEAVVKSDKCPFALEALKRNGWNI